MAFALTGCLSSGQMRVANAPNMPSASDGLGSRPVGIHKNGQIKRAKQSVSAPDMATELAALAKFSPEWWALHDAIERREDEKLAKTMIICRGCLVEETDHTGSIKSP